MMRYSFAAIFCAALLMAAPARTQAPLPPAPGAAIQYTLEPPQPLSRFNPQQIDLLEKLNRVDRQDLPDLKTIVVPDRWDLPIRDYSPLPQFVPGIAGHAKAIVVDLPVQVFGAYANGHLVRWGPVNTGKAETTTPPGLCHLNWKARVHVSTGNPKWKMPYYFNFANYLALGMHEYHMPGRPVSHGCVRMLGRDADWLFHWGQGWDIVHGKKAVTSTEAVVSPTSNRMSMMG